MVARFRGLVVAAVYLAIWLYFAPDFSVPLGQMSLGSLLFSILWLLLILPVGFETISALYTAFTGRAAEELWGIDLG